MTTDPPDHPALDDPQDPILGLDNVRLDLPLAGVGSRALAMAIDQLLLGLLLATAIVVGLVALPMLQIDGAWVLAILGLVGFFIYWGYFSAFEIATEGQTPGKMALGLRTVSHLGGRPSAVSILVRNILRSLDLLIGMPLMVLDRRSRRLGDMVASTLVVHHRSDAQALGPRLHRVPPSWRSREIAVVESFLRRAERMDGQVARDLAGQLLDWLRRREPTFVAEAEATLGQAVADPADAVGHLRRLLLAEV